MALCARCGQQTADGMDICSICASPSGSDSQDEPTAARTMTGTADYLRPFAAEGTAYPELPDLLELASLAVRSPAAYVSTSGYPQQYLPPPYGPAVAPAQPYRLRGPFAPLVAPQAPVDDAPANDAPANDAPTGDAPAGEAKGQARDQGEDEAKDEAKDEKDDQAHTAMLPVTRLREAIARPLSGGRWIAAGVAAGVVIITAVVAIVLISQGGSTAGARGGSDRHGSAGSGSQRTAAASARAGSVAVTAAAAAGPDAKAVTRLVTRYFRAINRHDFATYRTLFSVSLRAELSSSAFMRGYGTSRDSLTTLRSITPVGDGELDATVSFTSHQRPADTPSHSACTTWSISLYLVRQGHGYVIVSPPAGYRASYVTCS